MKFFAPVRKVLSLASSLLRHTPHLSGVALLIALGTLVICLMLGYHENFEVHSYSNVNDLPKGWEPPPTGVYLALHALAYIRLFALLGGVVFHLVIIRAYPDVGKMILPTWIASIYLTCWAVASSLYDRWEHTRMGTIGEEFSTGAYVIHLLLMIGMFISPPLALHYFKRCRIMERYVLSNFLHPLAFCVLGFASLWVVMDLKDNLAQFQENQIPMGQVLVFYFKLLPFIYVYVAPVTLLLATLYSLGKMSRSNELISMLGAGKSLGQILRPIFIMGAYASFLGMAANYEWAPQAEGNKKALLQVDKDKTKGGIMAQGMVYRNNEDRRTWFLGVVPYNLRDDKLRRVEVRQENEKGQLEKTWIARSSFWWPDSHVWSFYSGVEVDYEDGIISRITEFKNELGAPRDDQEGWSETPWILLSGSVTPEFLGVPTLLSYLSANKAYTQRKLAPFRTHFFYRFAVPMQCIILVLVAAPLGVVFSRRGMLGGIASAVFIFFILMFIDSFFLKMGTNYRMAPWLAPWIPHMVLGCIGSVLFYFRSQNRDFPKLTSISELADAGKFLMQGVLGMFSKKA